MIRRVILLALAIAFVTTPGSATWLASNAVPAAADATHTRHTLKARLRAPVPRLRAERQLLDASCLLPRPSKSDAAPRLEERAAQMAARGAVQASGIRFTENRGQIVDDLGQARPEILYTAETRGLTMYFTASGVSYVFRRTERRKPSISEATGRGMPRERMGFESEDDEVPLVSVYRMDMKLDGCNPDARVRADGELEEYSNYYYAHCPQGITHVKQYARLVYENIYDNIDLVFLASGGRMKYEYIVQPGGDPEKIRMRYDGATDISVRQDHGIEISTPIGRIEEQAPYVHQKGREIPSTFLTGGDAVSFAIAEYDAQEPLIIDPWATYFGASGEEWQVSVVVDSNGDIILGGETDSMNFPVLNGVQMTYAGGYRDLYFAKFSATQQLLWSTYWGGPGTERTIGAGSICTDSANNIYATAHGTTGMPMILPYQSTPGGVEDPIILKLNSAGMLQWSTYLGGSGVERPGGVHIGLNNTVIVSGFTESPDFPVLNAYQPTYGGKNPVTSNTGGDVFVSCFQQPTGSLPLTMLWSTFIGGPEDERGSKPTTDANGNIYIVGAAQAGAPLINPYLGYQGGWQDAYLMKLSPSGTLLWASYFGGTESEALSYVETDPSGNIWATGGTGSTDIPLLNPIQNANHGSGDGFFVKFSPSGSLLQSSYFGGSGGDNGTCLATNSAGDCYIGGATQSVDFPLLNPAQPLLGAHYDAFIMKVGANGSLLWSTYYGGSIDNEDEPASGIDVLPNGSVVVVGYTACTDFPVYNAYQSVTGGNADIFIVNISSDGHVAPPTPPAAPTALAAQVVSPTKTRLQWTDNANNESTFIIETNKDGAGWMAFKTVPGNTVKDTVKNLAPLSTYEFRVKAANSQFQSPPSNVATVTLPAFAAPSALQATAVSISSVELRWQDNSTNEDMFVVQTSRDGTAWSAADTVGRSVVDARIDGLAPSTLWQFRVRAVEGLTPSAWSNTATATTFDFPPPANLLAYGHSHAELRLTWTDASSGETGFAIDIRETAGLWRRADTAAPNATEWIVGGLQANTTYECRIAALSGEVQSGYSNVAQATTLVYLDAPINLTGTLLSERSVRLQWEDRSSMESGFEVEQQESGGAWLRVRTTAANEVTCEVDALTPQTPYRFRVRAVAQGAASTYSNEWAVETRMTPAAPRDLLATAVDSRSIRITWRRGSENEQSYELQRKIAGGTWETFTSAGPGDGSVLDEGLAMATLYWYRARAINALGTSGWSNEDSAMTYDVAVPEAPFALRAKTAMSTSIRLAWVMPTGSFVEGFEIEQSPTGDAGSFARVLPDAGANDREYTAAGLQPESYYYFRVRAYNRSGASGYSNVLRARTSSANSPETPYALKARALSGVEIELTWSTPTPSKADGYEIEMSMTGGEADFSKLSPTAVAAARSYLVPGLTPNTRYYFRLRAYNAYGTSDYSDTASAVTMAAALDQQLIAAINAKEALYPGLENLIAAGDAEMGTLRTLFGDYARGYDETPARSLIASWWSTPPAEQARAAEALERFTLFEQALGSGFRDAQLAPPVPGAWQTSREASGAAAVLTKDACALALAWSAQRSAQGGENRYVDAAVEDLLLPVADGTATLMALMGAHIGDEINAFTETAIRGRGTAGGLSSRTLLSVLNYWQERMAARHYVRSTQPAIAVFAEKCRQLDIGDTKQSAIGKRDAFVQAVRDRTDALSRGYASYAGICTGLDAAYAIGQTPAPSAEIFLQRLTQLRPRLVDGMHSAISDAIIPIERFLYLTTSEDIPGLNALPHALGKAGNAIYHPEIPGAPATAASENAAQQLHGMETSLFRTTGTDPAIESDRTALIALREKVVAADAAYALAQFDALRASGREMTAAVARAERPLLGIAPAELYRQSALQDDYYGIMARSGLLKTRRTVLSVALADYGLAPTSQKQAALVAEIDSILGPLDGVLLGLEDLKSGQAGGLIALPALALVDAEIVRDAASGPTTCRLRFAVRNDGGASAAAAQAELSILTEGVTAQGAPAFVLGDIAVASSASDSLMIDVPVSITAVTFSAKLQGGGRNFIDRRTLPVPQATNATEAVPAPESCILHQNHPNPFTGLTSIGFTLSRAGAVTLVVTDMLGREVARLCDGERRGEGTHAISFDARALPSGAYVCRLDYGGQALTRIMHLVK